MDIAGTPTNPGERAEIAPAISSGGPAGRRGVAAEQVRRHNLGIVLERLHLTGPLSRSELTSATGLNRSTVADLLGELTALGLVEERPETAPSGPGRPSPVVHPRPDGAVVLAVEMTVDSVAVATVGLGGHVYNRIRIARPRGRFSPEETVQDVAKLAGPLLDALPGGHVFAGVGAAVAGITRRSDGFVHLAPNLGWRNVPLAAMLAEGLDLGVPVLAANEADLGALAEHRRGSRPGVDNLIFISGEVGIGAGIIVDGKPLLGASGYAGEAGHMLINPDGLPCGCGETGCWETEAGEAALLRRAGLDVGPDHLDLLAARATQGDEATLRAIEEVGRWLGLGIGNLVNLFNPELVVVGGLFHRLFRFFEPSVLEGMRVRALEASLPQAGVVPSALGSDAHLIGAAELVMSAVIADPANTDGRPAGTGGRARAGRG
ncbi:MAG TPA: ROK family transcriptional regulator [Actinomycetota bacterium]